MRPLRFYLIPAGYWSTLFFGVLWLALYINGVAATDVGPGGRVVRDVDCTAGAW